MSVHYLQRNLETVAAQLDSDDKIRDRSATLKSMGETKYRYNNSQPNKLTKQQKSPL
jgi:hypothetical protein